MSRLITIDGGLGEGGGQILRSALTLSAATTQAFRIENIRARRSRPGLRPQHVAAVHAAALACGARVGGCFEGSPDLRFDPGPLAAGEFRHEIGTAGSASLVLQTLLPALARASAPSQLNVTGGSHVPRSPSYEFVARHWAPMVSRLGLRVGFRLLRAGYHPPGGGEMAASVASARPEAAARLELDTRGALLAVRVVAGGTRARLAAARAAGESAAQVLWERRRLEVGLEVAEHKAASPGWYLYVETEFERGRAAFGYLPQRRSVPEQLGAAAARDALRFLERDEAVDPWLADQLAVPMALSGKGGRVTTPEVSSHLESVASVLGLFGVSIRLWGRHGGPGGFEIEPV